MQELVLLAEERETQAKRELAALLGLRAEVFDSAGSSAQSAVGGGETESSASGAGGAAGASETAAAAATGDADASVADGLADADNGVLEALAARTAEARRRKAAAEKKFSRLSQVCVAAEQGLQLLSERLGAAMSRGSEAAAEATAGKGSGAASDRRRTSLVNGMRRITSVRRSSLGGIRRVSAVGFIEGRRQSQAHTVLLDAGAAADIATHVPAGSGITDKDFFPALPGLVATVTDQLGRLLALEAEMEAAEAMVRDADRCSLAPSEASEAAAGSPPSSAGGHVRWADRQATPRVGEAAEREAADASAAAAREARSPEAAAADGEKQLRKGFRRRTWAGPAWLDGVAGKARGKRAGCWHRRCCCRRPPC